MIIRLKNKQTLQFDDFSFKCSIGKNGISSHKIEGDKKTPKGKFNIGDIYYRGDKIKSFKTKLKKVKIKKNMGWCDDVSSKEYNKLIKVSKKVHHEKLFRIDEKYDLLIPIKYNFNKPKKIKVVVYFYTLQNLTNRLLDVLQ